MGKGIIKESLITFEGFNFLEILKEERTKLNWS